MGCGPTLSVMPNPAVLARRVPLPAVDAALAAFFTVVGQLELQAPSQDGYHPLPGWLDPAYQAVFTLLLLLRSARPRLTFALMCAWLVLPNLLTAHGILFYANFVPLVLVSHTLARRDAGWLGRWSWLVGFATVAAAALRVPELRDGYALAYLLVVFGVVSVAGRIVRRLTSQRKELVAALADLAREQEMREARAVETERRRIAAELHDVVAHSVSLMAVQVGAARLQLESTSTPVPPQLRAAEETGRRAVADLRRSLGVLREDETSAALDPLPDLSALPELVRRFEDAGLRIHLDCAATPEAPPSLQLTVYRIVQESLTNALKHAGPVEVDVTVTTGEDDITVTVVNAPGPRPGPSHGPGHGLDGMRERVALYDGELHGGPRPDGRFEVLAQLPCPAPESQPASHA